MQEFAVILMLKQNGVLEKELCSISINKHGELLSNAYVTDDDGNLTVRLLLTVSGELKDWEYEAFFDYYDEDTFADLGLTILEQTGGVNPVWEFSFPYLDEESRLSSKINGILNLHSREIQSVREAIKDAEEDYAE